MDKIECGKNVPSLTTFKSTTSMAVLLPTSFASSASDVKLMLHYVAGSCRFEKRIVTLKSDVKCEIGRAVAGVRQPCKTNAIFDCKVLSRNHATVWHDQNGKFWLKDENSSNGTFLNGFKLKGNAVELNDGDIIQLGSNVLSTNGKTYFKAIIARIELSKLIRVTLSESLPAVYNRAQIQKFINALEIELDKIENEMYGYPLRDEVLILLQKYQNASRDALRKAKKECGDTLRQLSDMEYAVKSSKELCENLREQKRIMEKKHEIVKEQLQGQLMDYQQLCVEKARQRLKLELESNHRIEKLQQQLADHERIYKELCGTLKTVQAENELNSQIPETSSFSDAITVLKVTSEAETCEQEQPVFLAAATSTAGGDLVNAEIAGRPAQSSKLETPSGGLDNAVHDDSQIQGNQVFTPNYNNELNMEDLLELAKNIGGIEMSQQPGPVFVNNSGKTSSIMQLEHDFKDVLSKLVKHNSDILSNNFVSIAPTIGGAESDNDNADDEYVEGAVERCMNNVGVAIGECECWRSCMSVCTAATNNMKCNYQYCDCQPTSSTAPSPTTISTPTSASQQRLDVDPKTNFLLEMIIQLVNEVYEQIFKNFAMPDTTTKHDPFLGEVQSEIKLIVGKIVTMQNHHGHHGYNHHHNHGHNHPHSHVGRTSSNATQHNINGVDSDIKINETVSVASIFETQSFFDCQAIETERQNCLLSSLKRFSEDNFMHKNCCLSLPADKKTSQTSATAANQPKSDRSQIVIVQNSIQNLSAIFFTIVAFMIIAYGMIVYLYVAYH